MVRTSCQVAASCRSFDRTACLLYIIRVSPCLLEILCSRSGSSLHPVGSVDGDGANCLYGHRNARVLFECAASTFEFGQRSKGIREHDSGYICATRYRPNLSPKKGDVMIQDKNQSVIQHLTATSQSGCRTLPFGSVFSGSQEYLP